MKENRKEFLKNIEQIITNWKEEKTSEINALDDIYDVMQEYSSWEESEMRKRRNEEWEKNSEQVTVKVHYAGKLQPKERN